MALDGPLHRLDARVKLVAAVVYVVAVVATPLGSWRLLGLLGLVLAMLIAASGASPVRLFTRWLGFLALVGFLAAVTAGGLAARANMSWGLVVLNLLIKNSLAFLMMLVLVHVTTWPKLLLAMRRLGMPPVLAATLSFMDRYVNVLRDELERMRSARRARWFRRRGDLSIGTLSTLIGVLLLRALEREERVHAAMTARGWDGTIRTLED
ncbi:energy-coupling factor transporter transmembrane component T family protein [Paludisphaera borealis]|uniref:Nickel transport protein NikQ n=1 Tax=Paludisphaera borealis TaxID=1387353 RepID=A0A1U7CP60_9BACT|nr:CbiQ family ECF transporter T component [Paludisphaera borealis]APW60725.1 Nickel transport protein NikQ [Paludisphaera borealis]